MKLWQKPPKLATLALAALLLSGVALGEEAKQDYRLLFQAGSYNFSAKRPGRAAEEISGFGSYSLSFGVGFWKQYVVDAGMTLVSSQGFGGDTATGFDLGLRYYPMSTSGYQSLSSGPMSMHFSSVLRPYAGVALRQRQFLTTLTTTYVGPGVNVGLDWLFRDKVFANVEFRYDFLTGQSESTATQMNLLVGIGLHL
ncbi:MAG: hypothetical protein AB7N80_07375 [Bdellovibrionales bacterium]